MHSRPSASTSSWQVRDSCDLVCICMLLAISYLCSVHICLLPCLVSSLAVLFHALVTLAWLHIALLSVKESWQMAHQQCVALPAARWQEPYQGTTVGLAVLESRGLQTKVRRPLGNSLWTICQRSPFVPCPITVCSSFDRACFHKTVY